MDYLEDKSWMYGDRKHRYTPEFVHGVMFFIEFGFRHIREGAKEIRCPCSKCKNQYWRDRATVHDHVVYNGFLPDYYIWEYHGEEKSVPTDVHESNIDEDIEGMSNDAFGMYDDTVDGYKFKAMSDEETTQNSGVVTIGGSGGDDDDVLYYGVLTDVLEFEFMDGHKQFLFKCDWYDIFTQSGMRIDEYNFTNLNTNRRICEDEPFIFPSSAEQVYYSSNPMKPDWHTVLRWKPRDLYDMSNLQPPSEEAAAFHEFEPTIGDEAREIEDVELVREDFAGTTLELEEFHNILDNNAKNVRKKRNRRSS